MMNLDVFVISKNALVRKTLAEFFEVADDIHVVATGSSTKLTFQKAKGHLPHMIITDFEDYEELTAEERKDIFQRPSLPILFLRPQESAFASEAIEHFEIADWALIDMPSSDLVRNLRNLAPDIEMALRRLSLEIPLREKGTGVSQKKPLVQQKETSEPALNARIGLGTQLIVMGASTGGTAAITHALSILSDHAPPVVVVVHMPAKYTGAFAARVNGRCEILVEEARNGLVLQRGHAVIASGHTHLKIAPHQKGYRVVYAGDQPVNGHCPSVDVLFHSAASVVKRGLIGVLLTGMGRDGAEGLLAIKESGGHTIAQDEQSSVVFGMPKCAIEIGGACDVLSLEAIAETLGAVK